MKVFIIGFKNSGRTTIAKELASYMNFSYVDACVTSMFRPILPNESQENYSQFIDEATANILKLDKNVVLTLLKNKNNIIVDGIQSPIDIINCFDYNQDYIVFCNRTDYEPEFLDKAKIGIALIKDYCYWLSSLNLISAERWIECNYKLPGPENVEVKKLNNKNSIYITKNMVNTIELLKKIIKD